jgi:hypothetical protein
MMCIHTGHLSGSSWRQHINSSSSSRRPVQAQAQSAGLQVPGPAAAAAAAAAAAMLCSALSVLLLGTLLTSMSPAAAAVMQLIPG